MPAETAVLADTDALTGSYVVRRPSGWSMLTTPTPATDPAKTTTPAPAASTASPGCPARSTPRCPASHGWGGGSKGRVTTGVPGSGQR
jgi:hypothetical protein